jgi:hypothetical protein
MPIFKVVMFQPNTLFYECQDEDWDTDTYPLLTVARDVPSQSILQNYRERFPAEFCPTFRFQRNVAAQALVVSSPETDQLLPVVCLGQSFNDGT